MVVSGYGRIRYSGGDCCLPASMSAAEMRLYKDTGMVAAIWLVAGLLAGSGLIVGRNPRMSSRCASSSDAGRAGRKARRGVLRTFLGAAFVTAAGGTLTLAQGWREASWLFLIAPALVALIAAVRISAGKSQRSSATAVVPVLWALLFGLPVLVAGYAVFSLRDPSLSLSSDRLRIGGAYGERIPFPIGVFFIRRFSRLFFPRLDLHGPAAQIFIDPVGDGQHRPSTGGPPQGLQHSGLRFGVEIRRDLI